MDGDTKPAPPGLIVRIVGTLAMAIGALVLLAASEPDGGGGAVLPGILFLGSGLLLRIEGAILSLRRQPER